MNNLEISSKTTFESIKYIDKICITPKNKKITDFFGVILHMSNKI